MQREYRTKCRDYIMEYLRANPENRFRASDLYKAMCADGHHINLTTVYRNLERLSAHGTLLRFKSSMEGACLYQYSGENHHCESHLHNQCGKCGKMVHLDGPAMTQFSDAIQQQFGFSLQCGGSLLLGYCSECQNVSQPR